MRHEPAPPPSTKESILLILTRDSSPVLVPLITSLGVISVTMALSYVYFGALAMDYLFTGFFMALFVSLGVSLLTRFFQGQLRSKEDVIDALSNHDPLTGLINRRHFFELGRHEFQLAQREHATLCMVLIRLTNLKRINEALGQSKGDELLVDVARHCKNVLRANDSLARYGGHEFVITLYGCEPSHAVTVTERVRSEIDKLNRQLTHPGMHAEIEIKSACLAEHIQTFDHFIDTVKEQASGVR